MKFEVGPGKQLFLLHHNVLCEESKVFAAAFAMKGNTLGFRESLEQAMSLPEDDPNIFNLFVNWMYSREFPQLDHSSQSSLYIAYREYTRLYVFSDRYDISSLSAQCLKKLYKLFKDSDHGPSLDLLQWLYDNTEPGTILRQLWNDGTVFRKDFTWFHEKNVIETLKMLPDISSDLLQGVAQRSGGKKTPFKKVESADYTDSVRASLAAAANKI